MSGSAVRGPAVGTSRLGPPASGLTHQHTDSSRYAIVSLVVLSVTGFVLLALLPMPRAVLAAGTTPPERS